MFNLKKQNIPFLIILLFGFPGQSSGQTGGDLEKLSRDIQNLIDSTKASVVTVTARFSHEITEDDGGFLSFFRTEKEKTAVSFVNIGTGVIFDREGHVLTRSSVVLGGESHTVIMESGVGVSAQLIGNDPETGFAVLKINWPALQPAVFGDSDQVQPGSFNILIGNSLGVYPSFVFGWINGVRSDGMIQLAASLNPGNNGSPIIGVKGEVLGLVAGLVHGGQNGVGYDEDMHFDNTTLAYPSNWIKRIAGDIIEHGYVRRGWLGVICYQDGMQPTVRGVKEESPALSAGLSEGDIIIKYGGKKVADTAELVSMVEYTVPGKSVPIEYRRNGQMNTVQVAIGEKPVSKAGLGNRSQAYTRVPTPATKNNIPVGSLNLIEKNMMLEKRVDELEKEIDDLKRLLKGN